MNKIIRDEKITGETPEACSDIRKPRKEGEEIDKFKKK